jgi:hypothetical protein
MAQRDSDPVFDFGCSRRTGGQQDPKGIAGPTVRIRLPPARSPLRTLTQHRQSDAEPRYIEAAIGDTVVGCLYLPNGNPAPGPKFDYKPMARRRPAVAARPYTHNGRTLLSTHSVEKRGLAERDLLLHIGGTMDQIGAPARFACCVPADAWNMLGMTPGSSSVDPSDQVLSVVSVAPAAIERAIVLTTNKAGVAPRW